MNRTFKSNRRSDRRGITLLVVVSMIVLFLLLGTAFVVVANNFNRDSIQRINSNVVEGTGSRQGNQLLEEAIYQLIRGTDLRNIDSPLRTNDMLADQYGYGIRSYVTRNTDPTAAPGFVGGGDTFIQFALSSDPNSTAAPDNSGFNLLTLSTTAEELSPDSFNGIFGGQVLSFVSGPAKGFSARIVADAFESGAYRFQIPAASISGDVITDPASLAGSEVIINGRDFSGTGAAVALDALGNPVSLGTESWFPNRLEQSHRELVGLDPGDGYLTAASSAGAIEPWSASVNEPWDAADIATMFLSGFRLDGTLIPSFYRRALQTRTGTVTSPSGRTSFHAFDMGVEGEPDVSAKGDGVNDSFWMDLGSPVATNRDGRRFKPLYAFHVVDMDGRLNVNAHSNRTHLQSNGFVQTSQNWAGGAAPNSPRGLGMGPPEINLSASVGGTGELEAILDTRYGEDNLPGDGATSFRSRAKLFGHPSAEINPGGNQFGTVGGVFGTAMDIHGRFRLGTPENSDAGFDDFSDLNFAGFNNALPQIEVLATDDIDKFTDEFSGNAYEMSLSGRATGDAPFTAEELERVLRPNDIDSRILPDRLSNLLSGVSPANRSRLFTTHCFDVPMLYRGFVEELNRNLQHRNSSLGLAARVALTDTLATQRAFAPRLYSGLKMDINRPFDDGIDNNGDGVFGEPGEEVLADNQDAQAILGTAGETEMDLNFDTVRDAGDANARVLYARNLYLLAMLLLAPVDLDQDGTVSSGATLETSEQLQFARAMAQWAVNVVDFRDADSIHTRFVYDPFPWDTQGWAPLLDDSGAALPPESLSVVWGCERPELLLTETLAVHLQNMEQVGTSDEYHQRLRPEPFAYFEVYNPWTQNRLNQRFDPSLYAGNGVDLGRINGQDSPVWRFEIERGNDVVPTEFKPLRYVYMADPSAAGITYNDTANDQVPTDIEVFFGTTTAVVRPGAQALIGTEGFGNGQDRTVYLGRRTDPTAGDPDDLEFDETTRLVLNEANSSITRYTASNTPDSTREASIVFVDQTLPVAGGAAEPRKFSLSDPFGGYPSPDTAPGTDVDDGFVYDSPFSNSLDQPATTPANGAPINPVDLAMIRTKDGINQNFRYVRLQRLANPLLAWDAVTNPYLTIDSMEVDLVSINGADAFNPMDATLTDPAEDDRAVSHERGDTGGQRLLWGFQRDVIRTPTAGVTTNDLHHFTFGFSESLGRTNDIFSPNVPGSLPFPWLTWNNRPFVSHMEIMNVPYLAPDRLTYTPATSADPTFTIDSAGLVTTVGPLGSVTAVKRVDNPYRETRVRSLSGRYGHLLNFFATETNLAPDSAGGLNSFSDVYKLLDFIEVPNRFVGNESLYLADGQSLVLRHPFNTISHYRVPGMVNINTIPPTDSVVWDALAAEYRLSVSSALMRSSLHGPGGLPTDFENPVRPAEAANLVPGLATQVPGVTPAPVPGVGCTLLRPSPVSGATNPLFDYDSIDEADNSQRSAAFRNGMRTRLANMTTTKSSVFAAWVVVGYFEVDENDELVDTSGAVINLGSSITTPAAEIGADTGEQVRNRGFFIFDRSIPVAYEPGKNHNIDKAILVKSIID